MRTRLLRLAPIMVSLLLIAAACNGDSDDTGDSGDTVVPDDTGDTVVPDDTTDTTDDEDSGDTGDDDDGGTGGDPMVVSCPTAEEDLPDQGGDLSILAPDTVITASDPDGEIEAAIEELDGVENVEKFDSAEALPTSYAEGRYGRQPAFGDEPGELLTRLFEELTIFRVTLSEETDIRAVIESLRASMIDARPLHAVKFEGHWGRLPAVDPTPVDDGGARRADVSVAMSGGQADGESPRIGVIDSGFVEAASSFVSFTGTPEDETDDPAEPKDPCRASHGTFAASVVKQVNPEAEVFGAAAPPLSPSVADDFVTASGPIGSASDWHELTDELAIAIALDHLTKPEFASEVGLEDGLDLDALNLSFGTYGMSTDNGIYELLGLPLDPAAGSKLAPPAILSAALALLKTEIDSDIQIFAAGGNQDHVSPMFPAAFQEVTGVGILSTSGDDKLVLWDQAHQPDKEKLRATYPWITQFEVGCDLIGIATSVDSQVTIWSGSSFATPVATARSTESGADFPSSSLLSDDQDLFDLVGGSQCD